MVIIIKLKTENQKTSLQSHKTRFKILPFPGLALLGTNQPGAMLLGWPKSTYCIDENSKGPFCLYGRVWL